MANYNINSRLYNGKGENDISNNNIINKSNIYKFSNFTGIMFLLLVLVNYSLSHGSENEVFVFPRHNYPNKATKFINLNWAKNKARDTRQRPPALVLEVVEGNINDKFKIANVRCKIDDNKIVQLDNIIIQLDNIISLNNAYLGFGKKKYAIFDIITKERNIHGDIVFSSNIYVYSSDINSLTHDIHYDRGIFSNRNNLSQVKVIACNTDNVTNMGDMFNGCSGLTELDLSKFNTNNVTNMFCMFSGCSSLTNLDLSKFNTSNVTNMRGMFYNCSSLKKINLSKFNTSNVTNMRGMFYNCFQNKATLICKASTIKKITDDGYSRLIITNENEKKAKINDIIGNKDNLEKVYTCIVKREGNEDNPQITEVVEYKLEEISSYDGKVDDVQIVKEKFAKMKLVNAYIYRGSTEKDYNDAKKEFMGKIKPTGETYLSAYVEVKDNGTVKLRCFIHCTDVNSINDNEYYYGLFQESKATKIVILSCGNGIKNMFGMFKECQNLKELDLSKFNTSNVTDMRYIFFDCSSLTELDLSNFNTDNVIDMNFMFAHCISLTNLNLSKLNTNNVTNMSCMFYNCISLTNLNLSNLNTNNVTNMSWMFFNCSKLSVLNLSNFNTDKVTNMSNMFYNCNSLTNLDLSNFNTNNVTDMFDMFKMFYKCFTEKQTSTLICKASTIQKITDKAKKSCLIIEDKDDIKKTIANDNNNIGKVYTCSVKRGEKDINPQITAVKEYKEVGKVEEHK